MKKRVLVLVFSNLKHDARVLRQVSFLSKHYEVSLVCFDAPELPGVSVIRVIQTRLTLLRKGMMSMALLLRFYNIAYRLFHDYESTLRQQLAGNSFDLILANDVDTLPLAFIFKNKAKVLFDAHEYAPRHFEDKLSWRIFFQGFNTHLCKKYIPKIDGMLTVGKGLADEYEKNFGRRPVIITNAARYHDMQPSACLPDRIRLVHHGIANPSRRLELMLEMMTFLDERFTLDLMLMTSDYASGKTKNYIAELKATAAKDPRITILPSVPSADVVKTINKYDIGIFLLPPINFNYANTLPNKLFDFIQARLAIAVGPTPEMAAIVRDFSLGVVSNDFTAHSLAEALNKVSNTQLSDFKKNTTIAAKKLNAEENEKTLLKTIEELLS